MNQKEFTEAIEMKKQLLSAMFMKEGFVVPNVAAIIDADDLYRPEYRLVIDATFTTARAEYHAKIIKEKANFRKFIELGDFIIDEAQRGEKSPADFFYQQFQPRYRRNESLHRPAFRLR